MTPLELALHNLGLESKVVVEQERKLRKIVSGREKSARYAAKPEAKEKRRIRDKERHAKNKIEKPDLAKQRREKMRAYYHEKKATDQQWYDDLITRMRENRRKRVEWRKAHAR